MCGVCMDVVYEVDDCQKTVFILATTATANMQTIATKKLLRLPQGNRTLSGLKLANQREAIIQDWPGILPNPIFVDMNQPFLSNRELNEHNHFPF